MKIETRENWDCYVAITECGHTAAVPISYAIIKAANHSIFHQHHIPLWAYWTGRQPVHVDPQP